MKYGKWILLGTLLTVFGCNNNQKLHKPENVTQEVTQPKENMPMDLFVLKVMDTCKAQLSDARKKLLAGQIARISQRFSDRQHQEAFVLLVCIESKFSNSVRSKVGAMGLTQVMPKYAQAFAQECGLGKIDLKDMDDAEVNLTVGACYFNSLLTKFDGSVTLALAGYNSGPDSSTTKNLKALKEGHNETMGYISKFSYLREVMNKDVR